MLPTATVCQIMSIASPSCSFASGCCNRHPISCRDTSRLRLVRDASCHSCCTGEHVYTRPGRVGSKFTTQFLHDSDRSQRCAQWGAFHDVLAGALPAHQNKMIVLREPVHAHSLLVIGIANSPRLIQFSRSKTFCRLFACKLHPSRSGHGLNAMHHCTILSSVAQSHVDRCTRVLCFELISTDLPRFCTARQGRSGKPRRCTPAAFSRASRAPGRRLNSEEVALPFESCTPKTLLYTIASAGSLARAFLECQRPHSVSALWRPRGEHRAWSRCALKRETRRPTCNGMHWQTTPSNRSTRPMPLERESETALLRGTTCDLHHSIHTYVRSSLPGGAAHTCYRTFTPAL